MLIKKIDNLMKFVKYLLLNDGSVIIHTVCSLLKVVKTQKIIS